MGQNPTKQATASKRATFPNVKEAYAAFNYGKVIVIQEEIDRLRVEWQIPDFLSLRREASDGFVSPVFSFLESDFYLMLSPFADDDVQEWSHIYLINKTLETSVTCTLGIKRVDGTVENISNFTVTAQKGWYHSLEQKFLKMGDLLVRQSILLSSDVLTLSFTIRRDEASHLEGKSLPETGCVSDNKTAQVKKDLSLLSGPTAVEENPKTNDKEPEIICSSSNGGTEINPKPSCNTFVSKETQTDNSEVHKNCRERKSLETKSISKLTKHLEDLLLKSKNHDIIIDVQTRRFKAHKFILRARSPVFSSMFQHDIGEKERGLISIEDCNPDVFDEFLKYAYTGKAKIDSTKSAVSLYYAGDKYDFQELKEMCVKYLKESPFEATSVCEVIKMATVHGETDLLEMAFAFFSENLDEILQTDEWQSFLQSNVRMANDMLKRAVKNLSKKTQKKEIAVSVECPSCLIKHS